MMPVLRVVSLAVAALFVVASSLFAQSDPMAKWKPSVGDKFVYDFEYQYSEYQGPNLRRYTDTHDTLTETILATDLSLDSIHTSVIRTSSGHYYWLHASSDSVISIQPLVIETNHWGSQYYSNDSTTWFKFDYSQSADSLIEFNGGAISITSAHGYYGATSQETSLYFEYSPKLHWFYRRWYGYVGTWSVEEWNAQLILSNQRESNVSINTEHSDPLVFVVSDDKTLSLLIRNATKSVSTLCLLDLLGRPIRSWQMPAEAGERQITLNVADVPSGVYFLRVSGGGVEEVKKVCIAH